MIKLEVQPYCSKCFDFDPHVTKPTKVYNGHEDVGQTNTIVRCKNANRCEGIKRYLEQQLKEGSE